MGTKKISQLETISDANLSGEAILPVVVSDPLIPNRKAKVNQLFKGVAQGTKMLLVYPLIWTEILDSIRLPMTN